MFKIWLSILIAITLICGTMYVSGQQILRISADDPQIQLSEDISEVLGEGQPPEVLNQQRKVDIKTSLATVLMVFDSNRIPVGSTASLNDSTPSIPTGIFDNVDKHGQDSFTWEPEKGVRLAAVVKNYKTQENVSGYIVVARSLREIEKRETILLINIAVGWVVTMIAASIPFIVSLLLFRFGKKAVVKTRVKPEKKR